MQAQGGGGMQHSKRHKPATIEELRLAIPMIDDRGRLVSPPGDASEASSKGGSSSAFSPPSSAAAAAAVAAAAAASDEPAAALSSAASAAFSSSPSLESASDLATMPPPRPVLKPGASSSVDPKNLDRVPQELSTDKQQPGILLPPPPATNPDLAATCSSFDVRADAQRASCERGKLAVALLAWWLVLGSHAPLSLWRFLGRSGRGRRHLQRPRVVKQRHFEWAKKLLWLL